jgi:hypothetical protein
MERQSTVQSVEVSHDGLVYSASYFIEHGVLRAKIGGRIYLSRWETGPLRIQLKLCSLATCFRRHVKPATLGNGPLSAAVAPQPTEQSCFAQAPNWAHRGAGGSPGPI